MRTASTDLGEHLNTIQLEIDENLKRIAVVELQELQICKLLNDGDCAFTMDVSKLENVKPENKVSTK